MATIRLRTGEVEVKIQGWNVIHTLRRRIVVPFRQLLAVRVHPEEAEFDKMIIQGQLGVGTYVPRRLAMGVAYMHDGPAFFEVRDTSRVVALDVLPIPVLGYRVRKLIVQIDQESPESAALRIAGAMEGHYGFGRGRAAPPAMPPMPAPGEAGEELVPAPSVELG
jgi:hypothetical protein